MTRPRTTPRAPAVSGRWKFAGILVLLAATALGCPEPEPPPTCGDRACAPSERCIREGAGLRCRLACLADDDCPASGSVCGPLRGSDGGVCRPPPPPCAGPSDACPPGRACQPWSRRRAWSWRCLPPGRAPPGAVCGRLGDRDRGCAPPAVCVASPHGPEASRCRLPCDTSADCPPPAQCALRFTPLGLDLCDSAAAPAAGPANEG